MSTIMTTRRRPSSNMAKFREEFKFSKNIVVLSGAGVSAESGVQTFRGAGGLWRKYAAQDLATPEAFIRNPSILWEFYHHRREVMLSKLPNDAHYAIAEAQQRLQKEGCKLTVITQNVDELHHRAGTEGVIELHGSLFKTKCTKCGEVKDNKDSPICPALLGKGAPDLKQPNAEILEADLPHCSCSGLLRPHVVWFGEDLDAEVLDQANNYLENCDLCLIVGTSSVVYPAAMFAPSVASRGVTVAEFNIETTPKTKQFGYYFEGPCGATLPIALSPFN